MRTYLVTWTENGVAQERAFTHRPSAILYMNILVLDRCIPDARLRLKRVK